MVFSIYPVINTTTREYALVRFMRGADGYRAAQHLYGTLASNSALEPT